MVDAGDRAHHRYLVPLCPSLLDPEQRALRVDVAEPDLARYPAFDPEAFPSLSDDDLRKVVFYPLSDDADRTRLTTFRELGLTPSGEEEHR